MFTCSNVNSHILGHFHELVRLLVQIERESEVDTVLKMQSYYVSIFSLCVINNGYVCLVKVLRGISL